MPDRLHIDFETFSLMNLKDTGSSVYARHASTEALMTAFAFNDSPIQQLAHAEGEPLTAELTEALIDPEVVKWAWNAPFEMQIIEHTLGLPVDIRQWRDTMVLALHCSLPGSLGKAGEVIGLPMDQQKDRRGKALMRKFSFPRKPTKNNPATRVFWYDDPDAWCDYLDYNVSDVESERAIYRRLRKYDMSADEWDLWFLDQEINRAGLPINRAMVTNALRIYEQALAEALDEMGEITGLANPNSLKQLLPWLQDMGYPYEDMKKGHIKQALADIGNRVQDGVVAYEEVADLYRVLELRAETSRTSIKKYYALDRATDEDGLLRNVLQMNGAARTGRYAGRIFQPQNLPRPEKRFEPMQPQIARAIEHLDLDALRMVHGNPFDVLASALRPAAQAPEGFTFLDADLNAIENRVLGWLASCDKILDVFKLKRDPYLAFAAYLYDQPYEDLWHEYKVLGNGAKRSIGKPGTLGAGYGMGAGQQRVNHQTGEIEATGLLGYAWGMGVSQFTQEDAQHSIDTFRREFKEVKSYWYALEKAAKRCVRTGKPQEEGFVRFDIKGPFMRMILPSGRPLHYLRPKLEERETPWGEMRQSLTYEGLNDKKQWVRTHTTPGKIVENADQAISRDLLVHGMKLAKKEGLDIRLHVHDQITPLIREEDAAAKLPILIQCMEEVPSWAPGLPLGSAGHITTHFIKD
jgi:DNA polymerase